jgi:hypothetical protein
MAKITKKYPQDFGTKIPNKKKQRKFQLPLKQTLPLNKKPDKAGF